MNKEIAEILNSPEFAAALTARIQEQREEKSRFVGSDTFQRMLTAMSGSANHLVLDNEEAAYFEDRVKDRLGWQFAGTEDVARFIQIIADPGASTVQAGTLREDGRGLFPVCTFTHYGLKVRMMFGQGTSIVISNRDFGAE